MKKMLFLVVFYLAMCTECVCALELPKLYSDKVILYDIENDEVLYDLGGGVKTSVASLTKIASSIVALENIRDLDEVVTIDAKALAGIPWDASRAGLVVGDRVTYRDLLYSLLLPSGADAANALAYFISGSTSSFVELMNELVTRLNLLNTHFVNVTGYDEVGSYSTALDVLAILKYALDNPAFKEIYKTRDYKLSTGLQVRSTLETYNRNMGLDISKIVGSKTGYTDAAGMCMSAIFKTNNREMILITLGAPYSYISPYNLQDTVHIIDYLDEYYDVVVLFKKGLIVKNIPVEGAKQEEYIIKLDEDISDYAEVDFADGDVHFAYEGVEELSYKNKKGARLGEVKYFYKDELLKTQTVYLEDNLTFSWTKFLKKHEKAFLLLAIGVVLLLLLVCLVSKKKRRRHI